MTGSSQLVQAEKGHQQRQVEAVGTGLQETSPILKSVCDPTPRKQILEEFRCDKTYCSMTNTQGKRVGILVNTKTVIKMCSRQVVW